MSIDSIISQNLLPQAEVANQNTLGKDDFLKLMLLQMQHQDPLNPMDNQQMLSQMAQFSSLEQMSNLNQNIENANETGVFMEATQLLGKTVTVTDPTASSDSGLTLSSAVKSVSYSTQGPLLSLENGQAVTLGQVLKVEQPAQP